MSKVYVTEIQVGMIIGKPIKTKKGTTLYETGYIIQLQDIYKLMENGIDSIETLEETVEKEIVDTPYIKKLKNKVGAASYEELQEKIKQIHLNKFGSIDANPTMKDLFEKSFQYVLHEKYKV